MFLLILFSLGLSSTWASEEETIFMQACFHSSAEAKRAFNKISFIKAPIDKIQQDEKCLDISIPQRRKQLYESYLQQKFGGQFQLSENEIARSHQCKIEVIKISEKIFEKLKVRAGTAFQLQKTDLNSHGSQKSSLIISDGLKGSIRHGSSSTEIECHYKSTGLNLIIQSSNQRSGITTSRFIKFGETLDIGSFSQTKNDEDRNLSIGQGINNQNGRTLENIKIFLRALP